MFQLKYLPPADVFTSTALSEASAIAEFRRIWGEARVVAVKGPADAEFRRLEGKCAFCAADLDPDDTIYRSAGEQELKICGPCARKRPE